LKEFDKEITLNEYIEIFCGGTIKDNAKKFIEIYGIDWDYDTSLDRIIKKESELLKDEVKLKNGAREILDYLRKKGYKIAL
ncbi:HAD hydrolase-like protein, partial [Escherichia coli]|uniref:HAD hydrolase-like protein n=1 Tax=Escherichia coli TaxID=562 RepID=UPI00193317E6